MIFLSTKYNSPYKIVWNGLLKHRFIETNPSVLILSITVAFDASIKFKWNPQQNQGMRSGKLEGWQAGRLTETPGEDGEFERE